MSALDDLVRATVAALPALTDEQCARVAELLRPTAKKSVA